VFEHDPEEKRKRLDVHQLDITEVDDENDWIEVRYYTKNVGNKKQSEQEYQ
jgi:hypothetical protein